MGDELNGSRSPPVVLEPTEELPPLPQFESEDIRRQVFTHRSFHGRPNHIFEDHPDDPAPDNEKLEHVGDTVLSLVVTTLMNEMYPTLRVGPSTKMRALIVNNATLANIAVRYNLPNDLRLHPAQAVALKASANVQADLFESYVGGLHQDRGFEVVQRWLRDLFRPYAVSAYRIVRTQHGLLADSQPPRFHKSLDDQNIPSRSPFGDVNRDMTMTTVGHLALFNQHIQRSNQPVEWIYDSTNPEVDPSAQGDIQLLKPEMMKGMKATTIWSVRVMVNGKCLGKGRGGTKKLARNEAAKLGLKSLGIHV
ncbi:ribonuclease III [Lentinula edodes]|nr:ribonuclease III [Lentinula edodes]